MDTPFAKSDGTMTINLPGMIKILGENLYSDPSVAIRELLQNANDSCVIRKEVDANAPDPEINISYDRYKCTLIIEDNGTGLTKDEVIKFLTVIGSSHTDEMRTELEQLGKYDVAERLIGRFGLGLLSAFIIGTRIEFVTCSYKEGAQAVWWQCSGGQEYIMGPVSGHVPQGTKVTISVDREHISWLLNEEKLSELIHLYADLLQVPIYLNGGGPINAMNAPWDRQATKEEYRDFVAKRYPNEAILDIIPVEINEDDGKFKVGGVLFVPKQPGFIVREHGDVIVYIRHMFVCKEERTVLPEWAKFVKGIIESPNLRETASREALLHDENLQRVRNVLGQLILDHLTRIDKEDKRTFKEIVTNHNVVVKAWAVVSDELFERVRDIVLFQADNGPINLPDYFKTSRLSKKVPGWEGDTRYIFYFITPENTHAHLFAAKGLRVINAYYVFDELFLEKYARNSDNVVLKRLDVGGDFIFEELEKRERKWVELEEHYIARGVEARVVRFEPEEFPAVMITPEAAPAEDQINNLLADPNLSQAQKNLVSQMWNERKRRRERLGDGGILHLNANNTVIQALAEQDRDNKEIANVLMVIYANAMLFSTQGTKTQLTLESSRRFFQDTNQIISSLMDTMQELQKLRTQRAINIGDSPQPLPDPEQTKHITCFVALPFSDEYNALIEALRDVLEVAPYFWEVRRADERYFKDTIEFNIVKWIDRSQCFAVDLSERNPNVMMELGYMYWKYPDRPLLLLQREGSDRLPIDIATHLDIKYPWNNNKPDQNSIARKLRTEIGRHDTLKNLQGKEHYLSERLFKNFDWIAYPIVDALVQHYKTVEDFVSEEPDTALAKLSPQVQSLGRGIVEEIQHRLRKICELQE